ncbi:MULTISPECIES: sulfite exporter TauE/SafE family protein [Allobacillus]|uniref:Probable membrane transporter protein n=1 Tax=Allobacillus halotolerans TaxID=570278 RepID=A0ABS6GMR7_9BACI|nr:MULTISPECIES: sulfite exporter TauE/SafE family protein [Allobacillus]MBU6080412.1 sulfite exporter TauE/SafE family protein [Allobacillus halotolerans]TSJ65896.1 sulfite exporter TauE/SafE family protein [Allobacillus sp. SKP2-8]
MVFLIMFMIGVTTAFIGSIAGLGGGVIFVPTMLFLAQVSSEFSWATPQNIVGISLVVMVFTGLSSALTFMKRKRVDIVSGSLFLAGNLPGALLGVYLNQYIQSGLFELLLGFLMLVIVGLFFIKKYLPQRQYDENHEKKTHIHRKFLIAGYEVKYSFSVILGILVGFTVGMLSGLFGIGGGSLMVPAMILLFGMPAHIAAPTSMFMIFFSSLLSSSAHILSGHIVWTYALAAIPGSYLGGVLGARVNQHLRSESIEWILRIIMTIVGIRLII